MIDVEIRDWDKAEPSVKQLKEVIATVAGQSMEALTQGGTVDGGPWAFSLFYLGLQLAMLHPEYAAAVHQSLERTFPGEDDDEGNIVHALPKLAPMEQVDLA